MVCYHVTEMVRAMVEIDRRMPMCGQRVWYFDTICQMT